MEVYVARQPIFKKNKKIYGYELLFREGLSNYFPNIDGDLATSKVLSTSFMTIGIEEVTGGSLAFINFTQNLLSKRVPLMFPPQKVVVELLEDVRPEPDVLKACHEITQKGYVIALDDFSYRPDLEPIISMAQIIKMDFKSGSYDELAESVRKLARYHVKLLAEKVETHEDLQRAIEMGFSYFQGYFFSKPEILKGKDISSPEMNLLEIMAEANKEDFQFHKLEEIITRDVAISYKLMRYINSAYFRRVNNISSIKQAIILLGERQIRRFISLIAMSRLGSEKPNELIQTSIIRAKFLELVGNSNGSREVSPSELFTLGIFSLIDAILDDSMQNLMQNLPLSDGIRDALALGKGKLKEYLQLAVTYERADWKRLSDTACLLGLKEEELPQYFLEALGWANAFSSL